MQELLKAASKAQELVASFADMESQEEVLMKLTKEELVARLIQVQTASGLTVATVIRRFLEEPDCALLNYEQISTLVQQVLPDAKTSSKTVASYASKQRDTWTIIPRKRFAIDLSKLV